MTDIQAALGLSQLQKLNTFVDKKICNLYNEDLKVLSGISIPNQLENTGSSWHLYIIRINSDLLTLHYSERNI